MSIQHLAPMIYQILSAPDTDLSTVSAKRVRKQLIELDPNITLEFIKQNKDAIDTLIGNIFEGLNNPGTGLGSRAQPTNVSANANTNGKRKREDREGEREGERLKNEDDDVQGDGQDSGREDEDGDEPSPSTPVPKKAKKAKKQTLTDEEYARKLSSELNQRPSRGSRNANDSSKKGASRSPKKKKSRAQIDDSDDDRDAEGSLRNGKANKTKRKASGGGFAKGGFAKEFALSEPLAAVMNTTQLSRPQIVKKLWEYIKGHNLQNPRNRKEILCDDALRAIFGLDKIGMFTMNKILGEHLYELDS